MNWVCTPLAGNNAFQVSVIRWEAKGSFAEADALSLYSHRKEIIEALKRSKKDIVNSKELIVYIFKRLVGFEAPIDISFGPQKAICEALKYDQDHLIVEFGAKYRQKIKPRLSSQVDMSFIYEGKEHIGLGVIRGVGRLDGKEAIKLQIPATLKIRDEHGLTDHHLSPPIRMTFTTSATSELCNGQVINIGTNGVDIKTEPRDAFKQMLPIRTKTMMGFELNPDLKIACHGRVKYHEERPRLVGVEFIDLDDFTKASLAHWITQEAQKKKELVVRSLNFKPSTAPPVRVQKRSEVVATENGRLLLEDEYEPLVLQEGQPTVLILSQDAEVIGRLENCLMRKYGIMQSKGRFSNVEKIVERHRPNLILIQERLGQVSGFDLCRTINVRFNNEFPILIIGDVDEGSHKHLQALAVEAVDFLPIEPFHPLAVFRKSHDTINLFLIDPSEEE